MTHRPSGLWYNGGDMPENDTILGTMPNEAAAEAVRERAAMLREAYDQLAPEMRARAFAVAGIEDMKALQRVKEAIAKVPEGGDWREAREAIAAELGDPEKTRAHAETVLRTNAFEAYAAARWRKHQADRDTMPYLVYHTVGDDRVRPDHAKLDGLVLPVDDPFWETHYPPWDWGCRCTVSGMTQLEHDEEAADPDSAFQFPTPEEARRLPANDGDFHFNPKDSLVPDIRDVAKREYAAPEALRGFCARMREIPVEMPDGTRTDVRAMMFRPAQLEAMEDVMEAGRADGREHAVLLDSDTGDRIGDMQHGRKGALDLDLSEARATGRTADVVHNHPGGNPTLSPDDAITGCDPAVGDMLSVADGGDMCLRMLDRSPETLRELSEWKERLSVARPGPEKAQATVEWLAWLYARHYEGKLRIEGHAK